MSKIPSITINDKEYKLEELSELARTQVANVQIVDGEIVRLQQQLAIAQTARNAYFASLIAEVESSITSSVKKTSVSKANKAKIIKS